MVCYLAWFATVTHLSGLSIMSKHLHGRSWERKSRMVLMGILLVVLVVAMVPMAAITISEDDGGEDLVLAWNCNATCFFSPQFMGKNIHSVSLGLGWGDTRMLTQTAAQFGSAIVAVTLMCFSFIIRFGRITPSLLSTTKSMKASTSTRIQRVLRRIANKHFSRVWQDVLWRELLARPLLCVFLLLRTWLLLWSSMFFEVSPNKKWQACCTHSCGSHVSIDPLGLLPRLIWPEQNSPGLNRVLHGRRRTTPRWRPPASRIHNTSG